MRNAGTTQGDDGRGNEEGSVVSEQLSAAPPRAVFVDLSGRRGRVVRRICWLFGGLAGAYVTLVLIALVVPAGLGRLTVPGLGPVLPGPAAPVLHDARGASRPPSRLLQAAPPEPGPRPSDQVRGAGLVVGPGSVVGLSSVAGTDPTPAAPRPSVGTTLTPVARPAAAGSSAPTAQPSQLATPPGQTAVPPGHAAGLPGKSADHPAPRSTTAASPKPHPTRRS